MSLIFIFYFIGYILASTRVVIHHSCLYSIDAIDLDCRQENPTYNIIYMYELAVMHIMHTSYETSKYSRIILTSVLLLRCVMGQRSITKK